MFEAEDLPEEFSLELDFVRLMLKTPKTRSVGVEHAWASKTLRNAIHMVIPSKIKFDITLPQDARLTFATRATSAERPISIEITVQHGGASENVFSEAESNHKVWSDHILDLSKWSGRTVQLEFSCEGEKNWDILYLANPCIYTPDEASLNVIIYLIDALRPDHMGAYGYPRDTTPNIDALLDHAIVFEHAYSTAPRTAESVPSIMTSLPSIVHGVTGGRSWLPRDKPLLQEILNNHGYATASFITNVWAGPKSGLDRGFDFLFDDIAKMHDEDAHRTLPDEIHTWLESNGDKPFFIYVHTAEPHAPYSAPPPFQHMFSSGDVEGKPIPPRFDWQMNDDVLQATKDLYDGEVRYADDSFGRLIATLKRLGIYDETVILVLADHGEEFYEHGKSKHGLQLYIESIHIPFIFIGKRLSDIPKRIDSPISTLDIMPTVLELVGAGAPEIMFGKALFNEDGLVEPDDDRPIVAEFEKGMQTLIKGDWALHRWEYLKSVNRHELYNISKDYGETKKIEDERRIADMESLLDDILLTYEGMQSAGEEFEEIDIETMERLRSLGYIE
jgi:arylsulfatase A-like enzyme